VAYLADRLAAEKLPDFPFKPETFFVFPGWLLAGSMLFAAGFALLGAVAPARRASRVDPMHVLAER
jgi:ABC-type antimicrobial peptide transport system permease subunit